MYVPLLEIALLNLCLIFGEILKAHCSSLHYTLLWFAVRLRIIHVLQRAVCPRLCDMQRSNAGFNAFNMIHEWITPLSCGGYSRWMAVLFSFYETLHRLNGCKIHNVLFNGNITIFKQFYIWVEYFFFLQICTRTRFYKLWSDKNMMSSITNTALRPWISYGEDPLKAAC